MSKTKDVKPRTGVLRGTVDRLFITKGFGFLRGEDGVRRFFHASYVEPAGDFDFFREGLAVCFVHGDGPKGAIALRVRQEAEDKK